MVSRDLLMCVGPLDIDRLFVHSLVSCCTNLPAINAIHLVTPNVAAVREKLTAAGKAPAPIHVYSDDDILAASADGLPGWSRQQAIKLRADEICRTPQIICVGADTVVLRPVTEDHLTLDGVPILYVGGSSTRSVHLDYERERLRRLAQLLEVTPKATAHHVDFVMDLFIFDAPMLRGLRDYLDARFGAPGLDKILPRLCETLEQRVAFGEWTLYALFALDICQAPLPIRGSNGVHLTQVHSERDLAAFDFSARIAHFVSKQFDLQHVYNELATLGVKDRFK